MSLQETEKPQEVSSQEIYSLSENILDKYGHPGKRATLIFYPRPGGPPGNRRGEDILTVQAPIVSVERDEQELKLWLRKTIQPLGKEETELTVHFQRTTPGLERVEEDSEGYVTGYWYKSNGQEKPRHVKVIKHFDYIPKEINFGWYMARYYKINPQKIEHDKTFDENLPLYGATVLPEGNDFLKGLLDEMQDKLKNKE